MNIFFFLIVILTFFFMLNIIKSFLKLVFLLFLFLVLILLLSAFFIYNEGKDIFFSINEKPNLYIIKENNTFITAFFMKGINHSTLETFSFKEQKKIEESFLNRDYKSLLSKYYKVIVIDVKFFQLNNSITTFKEKSIEEEFLLFLNDLKTDEKNNELLRYAFLFIKKLKTNPFYIILEYKKGNIIFFDEKITYSFFKYFF